MISSYFAFVVPTKNSSKTLPLLANSLLRQSFVDWKVVFVDGSTSPYEKDFLRSTCESDPRFSFIDEDPSLYKGIFGAMNLGAINLRDSKYILFWGSDDWAASDKILLQLWEWIEFLSSRNLHPCMIVGGARYSLHGSDKLLRLSRFTSPALISENAYRNELFCGSIPPHQGTVFTHQILDAMHYFDFSYSLVADMDFYLRLSRLKSFCVSVVDVDFVCMDPGGASGRYWRKRFSEVLKVYFIHYKLFFIVPLLVRYVRRLLSINIFPKT